MYPSFGECTARAKLELNDFRFFTWNEKICWTMTLAIIQKALDRSGYARAACLFPHSKKNFYNAPLPCFSVQGVQILIVFKLHCFLGTSKGELLQVVLLQNHLTLKLHNPPDDTSIKVHIFWEGHKIFRNLHLTFVLCSASQK